MIMLTNEIKLLIEKNPVALATVDKANKPNVIAVAFLKVVSDNQIVITDNYMTQTKENLQNNKNVCLVVWDKSWSGYKLIGTAEYFESGKWLDFVKKMQENKGLPAKGAIVVTVTEIVKLS